jgi:uncharacterized protein with gpF-like domain
MMVLIKSDFAVVQEGKPDTYKCKYSDPRTLKFYDRQYRYEVKQLNKEASNGRT